MSDSAPTLIEQFRLWSFRVEVVLTEFGSQSSDDVPTQFQPGERLFFMLQYALHIQDIAWEFEEEILLALGDRVTSFEAASGGCVGRTSHSAAASLVSNILIEYCHRLSGDLFVGSSDWGMPSIPDDAVPEISDASLNAWNLLADSQQSLFAKHELELAGHYDSLSRAILAARLANERFLFLHQKGPMQEHSSLEEFVTYKQIAERLTHAGYEITPNTLSNHHRDLLGQYDRKRGNAFAFSWGRIKPVLEKKFAVKF